MSCMDTPPTPSTRPLSELIDQVRNRGDNGLMSIHGLERLELLRWSDRVVAAYGKVYRKNKALVMDERLLPCPKPELMVALKVEFYTFALKQNTNAMEDLARAYLNISHFQPITPTDKIMLEELNLPAVPMMDLDAATAARRTLSEQEQRFLDCFRTLHTYLGMVENEKEILRKDLDAFVHALYKPGPDQPS